MLEVDGIEVLYGDARALDGVSLSIDEGAIVHDEQISLPRPRRRDHPEIVERRAALLTLLGVVDQAA